jgi:hypothetical protein
VLTKENAAAWFDALETQTLAELRSIAREESRRTAAHALANDPARTHLKDAVSFLSRTYDETQFEQQGEHNANLFR